MAAICHIGFSWRTAVCQREPILARALGGLYQSAKFGWHRCSTFDNTKVLIICTFGLKSPIHAPKNSVFFWEFDPINGQHYQQHPRKAHSSRETRHMTYRSLRLVHLALHSSPFYSTPQILHFIMLFNRPDNPKVTLSVGASALPSNTWLLGTTQFKIPNVITISSPAFAGLTVVTDRH